MLLEVVALTANISRYLEPIGETNSGYLAEGGVGLFGGHGPDLNAHSTPLGRAWPPCHPVSQRVLEPVHSWRLRLFPYVFAPFPHQLVDSRHGTPLAFYDTTRYFINKRPAMSTAFRGRSVLSGCWKTLCEHLPAPFLARKGWKMYLGDTPRPRQRGSAQLDSHFSAACYSSGQGKGLR